MDGKVGEVVQAVMLEAKRRAGSADKLIKRMDPAFRKSDSTISNYITGDVVPPADVFLEAARVMKIQIDEHLYASSLAADLARMKTELEELKRWREGGGSPKRP